MRDPIKETTPGRPAENAFTLGAEVTAVEEKKNKNMFGSVEADNRVSELPEEVTKEEKPVKAEEESVEKVKTPKLTAKSKKRAVADLLSSPVYKSDDPNSEDCIKQYTIYLKPKQVKFCKDICTGMVGVSWNTIVQKMIDSYMEDD